MAGAPVCWSLKRQPEVMRSTTGTEYIALAVASDQAIWLKSFMSEINLPLQEPIEIRNDCTGAVAQTQNSKKLAAVKAIDMAYHAIRERVERKTIKVTQIKSEDNVADVLTKSLGAAALRKGVSTLGLDCTDRGEC